jgi:hypothetical protein
MSGWPSKIRFRRAAKVGDNYATPSETEKISVLLKNSVCNKIKLEKITFLLCQFFILPLVTANGWVCLFEHCGGFLARLIFIIFHSYISNDGTCKH